MILDQPAAQRDLDVALASPRRAMELSEGKHADTLTILARVHAARADFSKAFEMQRRPAQAER